MSVLYSVGAQAHTVQHRRCRAGRVGTVLTVLPVNGAPQHRLQNHTECSAAFPSAEQSVSLYQHQTTASHSHMASAGCAGESEHHQHDQHHRWQRVVDLPGQRPADGGDDSTSRAPSSATSSASSRVASEEDLLDVVTVSGVSEDGDDDPGFAVCKMKTVSVSSLLMPSPCYVTLLLLLPAVLGFVLFLFVQYFVPVFLQLMVDM